MGVPVSLCHQMAEIAVNLVIDNLIPLLSDEADLLSGVRSQVTSVKDQLRLIRAYLKDADAKAEMEKSSNLVKEWVTQMREVSYRIEDVIDEYLYKVANEPPQRHGAVGFKRKIRGFLRSVISGHEISSKIGKITESIERLNNARETFGFDPCAAESSSDGDAESSTLHYLRLGAYFIEDDQLVGVDHIREELTSWLLEGGKRTVISVVGEGGLGKTTIVRNIYNKQKETRYFDCYAWVTVSRSLRGKHLLKTLLQSFFEEVGDKNAAKEINEMDNNTLIGKVREYLQGRSYMIVLDDVWEIDLWGGVQSALPKDKGRIIITTRNKGVAEFCRESTKVHIHELEPLHPEDALKLFHLKAFQFDPESCTEELMGLSQGFVKKCDGVPLAIVAMAGLFSTKRKNVLEWQRVYDSLRSKFSSDPHLRSFYQVLSESYHDLGYHLKLCFLYFGLFPEDYSISCVRLINLWIAEGFVEDKENEGQTLEEVAEEYLAELIARSLVKVAQVYPYGRVRRCRVHDLMHDFILKQCEELNFCQWKKSEGFRFNEWTRRLSIDRDIENATMKRSVANYGLLRSCFVFNIRDVPTPVVESLFSSFKLLVRLDCEEAPIDYIPEAIGNLLLLKYLNLRNSRIKTIPNFIGKLQNLETLDLRHTLVHELPVEINRLIKLHHLLVYSYASGVKLKEGVGHLSALRKLCMVDVSDDVDGVIMSELQNMKQMRRLGIWYVIRKNGQLLCSVIASMIHLCSLSIHTNEVLDLESLTDPPQQLQRLYLSGRLEKLPNWISRLKNLVKLRLNRTRLTEDPLPFLKGLPELLELQLKESYKGDELHFQKGWFLKLKILQVNSLPCLTTVKVDEGVMPQLRLLHLWPRPQKIEVPAHIQKMTRYDMWF